MSSRAEISNHITAIKSLTDTFDRLIDTYRKTISDWESTSENNILHFPGAYWKLVAYVDALVKLRIFIQENFAYIETLSLLAHTRYVFELSIWLKLLSLDEDYGLIYHYMLLRDNKRMYEDLKNHLEHEAKTLAELGAEERSRIEEATKRLAPEGLVAQLKGEILEIERDTDDRARLSLCLYADDSRLHGLEYQAHLVRARAIPDAESNANSCAEMIEAFKAYWSLHLDRKFGKKWDSWSWKDRARQAEMLPEYEFVYSYTSRLLHAVPASLTTNQKRLEDYEALLFLRYIHAKINWFLGEASRFLSRGGLH